MAVTLGPALTALFLLSSFGLLNSSPLHSCPDFCSCDQFSHLNCSFAGLSSPPQNIRASISDLDLSNNQLRDLTFRSKFSRLQRVWLGNNSVSHLSLCLDLDSTDRGRSRPRRGLGLGPWRRRRGGCLPWAPALQLLSVERNQLKTLPEGLGQQTELQILNLSFNKILKMEPEDLAHLKQLEELHLQNNLIVALQPQIFEKLVKLKVLDLSFNLLTTLHPSTFFSLRDFGTNVALRGNSWICDCEMRLLQSVMSADRINGVKTWSIECSWPVEHSGTKLLELQGQDLTCPDGDDGVWIQEDLTVRRGSRTLLTCSEPDAVWWTPNGQTAGGQNTGNLIITDFTEQDEGLYVCMSKSHQVHSTFNIRIHEKIRKTRSVPQKAPYRLEKMVLPRNTASNVTQSHFAMAVSLSVIITFIVAFILGVLLQPYICACWQKTKARKQRARTTTTAPNTQQEQYINEAYLHCEDVDDFEPHRERRVTFTEYTEEGGMQYYDTVAGDVQEGNGTVIRPRHASSDSSDDSGSENGTGKRKNVNNPGKKIEFEHIPDSNERGSLSSQSSISSKEVKILEKKSSTPNASKNTEEQVQKREVVIEVPQFTIESHNEILGFSSEPFAEWSPHQNDTLDNGDQFEFSDSVRSGSPVSPSSLNGSFKQPNILVPNVGKKISSASSSSRSVMSDGEVMHYTVNSDSEDEGDVFEKNIVTPKASQNVKSSSSSSDSDTEGVRVVEILPVLDIAKKEIVVKNELQKEEQTLPTVEQKPPIPKKRRAPLPPPRKVSTSSSDSKDEIHKLKQENTQLVIKQPTRNVYFEEQASQPDVKLEFKARDAANGSFSSSDNEDERIYDEVPEEDVPKLPIYSKQESSIAVTDTKPQSGTSSSSESEEEQENYYENIQEVTFPNKSPPVTLEPEPLWPEVNLVQIPKVKRRLDFKRVAQTTDASSSSDSEDEQLYVNVTKTQGKVPINAVAVPKPGSRTSSSSESEEEQENYYENVEEVTFPNKLPVATLEPEPLWPVINLEQVPKVKRHLDFKRTVPTVHASSLSIDSEDDATLTQVQEKVSIGVVTVPKPGSRTSSSSESEEEHFYENIQEVTFPNKAPVVAQKPEPLWPVVNLVQIPKVKRRLDFKRTVPTVDSSSSSSDSEDDVTLTQVQGKVPLGVVTVPKPGSGTSSSSDSEEEQEIKVKVNQENLQQTSAAVKEESQFPVIDLVRIPKVKRRLDIKERINIKMTPVPERVLSTSIKVPKPDSGTSSSSDSEDEQEIKVKVYQENLQTTISPIKPAIAVKPNQDSQWPMINLVNVPQVKQRLDIKTTQPASQSSSSDSEDERVKVTLVPEKKLPPAPISVQKPDSGSSSSSDSEDEKEIKTKNLQQIVAPIIDSPWPVIDLERIPKVKQRLDVKERGDIKVTPEAGRVPSIGIKPPKHDSGTSSCSESEDEWVLNEEKTQKAPVTPVQVQGKLPSTTANVMKPDSGTSSSSDSEDEQVIKVITKDNLQQMSPTTKQPTLETQWPVIDLASVPKVKRRLDIKEKVKVTLVPEGVPSTMIKTPKPESGTSSSSDSEDEQKIKEVKQHQTVTTPNRQPIESQWPVIDLMNVPKVKQRLEIKQRELVKVAPSTSIKLPKQDSGTSSSSESEDEQKIKVKENLQQTISPNKPPIAVKPNVWPVIDLVNVPKVKQRLDIKTTVTTYESSSSDSEDERVQVNVPGKLPSTPVSVKKPDSGTSSSSDSEDERKASVKSQRPRVDLVGIPQIKQRLDIKESINVKVPTSIKTTKSGSGTSSSSDSEDQQRIKVKVNQENLQQTISPIKPPIALKPQKDSQWPVINLAKVPKVKQRLDIKNTVQASESSSSDSEDERVQKNVTQVQGKLPLTSVQGRVPSTKSPQSESGTSSSSESEDERETAQVKLDHVQLVTSPTKQPSGVTQWPAIDPIRIPKLRRRLDIKEKVLVKEKQGPEIMPSASIKVSKSNNGTSSSSDSEDEQEIKIISKENLQQQANKQTNIEPQWPIVNLVGVPKLKQRLDVKQRAEVTPGTVSKPDLSKSLSSESEDESVLKVGATTTGSTGPQTKWPLIDLGDITRKKRRLNVKIPSQSPPTPIPYSGRSHQTLSKSNSSSSSSSDEEHPFKSSKVFPLPSQTNVGLDIKGSSVKPESHDSSSSSDDENDKSKLSSGSLKSEDNKGFIKVSPILGKPQSLTKTTQNIDDLRGKSSSGGPSPVVTPELRSKWASMSLGLSRFRKRLDITKTSSPTSPPPISPKQDKLSTDFDSPKSVIVTEQVTIAPMREQNVDSSSSSSESEDGSKVDGKSSRDEVDLSSIPKVKRPLNVTTTQKKSSSSSSSDEETVNQKIPDLSSGIPQVKRRLNIKAPTPPSSSSSSDDEKVYAHKFSDVTDQRSIEYKRTIMKSASYDSSASKTQWQTRREVLHIESNAQTPKKLSLDNIKRKLLPSKQNELPPNLRWTSVGSHLSEHPLPVLRRHHDGYTSPPPMTSSPPMPKHDSSDSSSSEDEQKEVKTTSIVTQKTYSPKNVTFNTSPTILNAANFEDRPERRGLSALKAMSSERRNWESDVFTESAPVSVDYSPEVQTVYRRTVETKMSQAQSYSVSASSPATEQRRLADMMYGIPSYKRHTIKSTELPEDPPPPVPSSSLPDESLDFTWRSPQSSLNRGSLGYYTGQQKITLEESVDEPFFDNPNISAV